jgi:hypothetical protein
MNLYDVAIPLMTRTVAQVPSWLDKAQAYAEQKKFDPQVLLAARLAPDQWSLERQIQVVAMGPHRLAALLQGAEPPMPDMTEGGTIADLRARIDGALEVLRGLKREDFDSVEDRVIPLPFAPGKGMVGRDFVLQFGLPNFFFHVTTAYAILRHSGVELGKMDYIGQLSLRDL